MSNKNNQLRADMKIQRKKKKRRRRLLIFTPILILLATGGVYFYHLWGTAEKAINDAYENDGRENGSDLREEKVSPATDNVSILFIGIDESEKRKEKNQSNQLSDALILATLNIEDHTVKLLSIPRDSYVYVPERDTYTKINHAHSYGGPKATIETVENFLNVPVDYYVRLNFNAFMDIVDTLGGVEIDVEKEIIEQDSRDVAGAIHLYPGLQTLDGEEALAYARTRKIDNDIERGKRQQELVKAIVSKALSLGSVLKYDELIETVGDNMKTSMSFNDIKSLIAYGATGTINLESYTLEGTDSMINGTYYYQVDEESRATIESTLRAHLDLTDDNGGTANLDKPSSYASPSY